jgi:hypothetical protein
MTLYKDRNNPPNLQEYQLVPVLHSDPSFLSYSLSSIGSNLITSSNVRFEYDERSDGMPFLDGRITLGLAYRNRLVAVCAGGLAQEGPIIQQLQNVSSKAPPANATAKELRSFRYTNGLYNGLDWKATLVRGWFTLISRSLPEVLPDTVGMPVWIQSAENNIWVKKRVYASDQTTDNYQTDQERLMRLSRIYDGTAAKLGGTIKDPQTHNLQLPERFSVGRAA